MRAKWEGERQLVNRIQQVSVLHMDRPQAKIDKMRKGQFMGIMHNQTRPAAEPLLGETGQQVKRREHRCREEQASHAEPEERHQLDEYTPAVTFIGIVNNGGRPDIQAIAPGISGALLTTVAGLAVAIPSLVGNNFIVAYIQTTDIEMDSFIEEFITSLNVSKVPNTQQEA